ncbi:GDP-L-fucose synthase family protein [Helicobacter anatolicus]|uniref:GDP-L-fucose synthase family protein n=1 Tax=Helicobacter anatolicus TaxID=2905874 RepID=UPI001E4C3477|nr:GDP-L-fucose synthase [Helicobacter anatolicus]MCE3040364.1 GDP-L-fucose synthase [Helicobacter anatolicus]
MKKDSVIFVAGHRGLVGSAILKTLLSRGYCNVIVKTREELDLLDFYALEEFFKTHAIEYVFLCAAKVGGIVANNTYRADFIYQNLTLQNHILFLAHKYGVKKLLFLGSSCIYPKNSPQPIKEEYLLSGELEYTNEPYAIAKIAGLKMCESFNLQYGTNFISVMPTNLYGENDNFDLQNSHVLPALMRKFHEAKIRGEDRVVVWGSGNPRREFLHSMDMAEACIFLMENINFSDLICENMKNQIKNTHINIGFGEDISIKDLAFLIKEVVGFNGKIIFDHTKPDGTLKKLLDSTKIFDLGWKPKINLKEGILKTYQWYLENEKK